MTSLRSAKGWEAVSASAATLLSHFQEIHSEDFANKAWFITHASDMRAKFVDVFFQMKAGEFYNAWCNLERVEIGIIDLFRNPFYNLRGFGLPEFRDIVTKWQALYPYKVFFSPEFIIKKETCSICNEIVNPWSSCPHRVGRVYEGRLCHRVVRDFGVVYVSLVLNPVQKYSVAFMQDKNGQTVDQYDYSLVRFLTERLASPFDRWSFDWTEAYHPHELFASMSPSGPCPCGSGKTYEDCCLHRPGVIRPHIQFSFENVPPAELPNAYLVGYGERNGPVQLAKLEATNTAQVHFDVTDFRVTTQR